MKNQIANRQMTNSGCARGVENQIANAETRRWKENADAATQMNFFWGGRFWVAVFREM